MTESGSNISFCRQTFGGNQIFWVSHILYPHHFLLCLSWLLEVYLNMQHSETISICFSVKNFSQVSYTHSCNSLCSKIFNSSEALKKPFCHVDTKRVTSNPKTPSEDESYDNKKQTVIGAESIQINHLWNQLLLRLKIQNKIHCKSKVFPTLIFFAEEAQNFSPEMQQVLSDIFSLEQTQAQKELLEVQHKKNRNCKLNFTETRSGTHPFATTNNKWINPALYFFLTILL